MPKKKHGHASRPQGPAKPIPLYRQKPPKSKRKAAEIFTTEDEATRRQKMGGAGDLPAPVGDPPTGTGGSAAAIRSSPLVGNIAPIPSGGAPVLPGTEGRAPEKDFAHGQILGPAYFVLREDGSIGFEQQSNKDTAWPAATKEDGKVESGPNLGLAKAGKRKQTHEQFAQEIMGGNTKGSTEKQHGESPRTPDAAPPQLVLSSENPWLRLYQGNCLELLDAIAAKYGDAGRFDAIFADPPYFLSNGGITCHAGRMVKVDKGDWDKSQGHELNHEFNLEWLRRCQKVLKPNGTIWVSGTHHVIFSIGHAMQQLGFKILNDIAWEKPNPPPNLSCRYFTHSTETILWAAKNEKSKHVFNYQEMRKVTGKQMKTVWRKEEFNPQINADERRLETRVEQPSNKDAKMENSGELCASAPSLLNPIWTLSAPGSDEKEHGKHPTQKPVAVIERCLLASTNEGDLVLDPFLGGGTTAVVAIRLSRACVGIEMASAHMALAAKRCDREIIAIWLRYFQVRVEITFFGREELPLRRDYGAAGHRRPTANQIDLDLALETINGSRVDEQDKPLAPTESIYHETKFVFLSCAHVERGAVVHTTVDVSLQEAWAKTPTGKKRETTHIVRCETEILRVK